MFVTMHHEVRKNLPTISLVIPVYNEESHLADCLRSALAQTIPFTEIIVVDNNSTDNTVAIALNFSEVRVLHEAKQGVVYARSAGFNAATSEIIARIDADTRLPADWTQQLISTFSDATIAAVSGPIFYHDMAASGFEYAFDSRIRAWLGKKMHHRGFLLGSNMAIQRDAWRAVASSLCTATAQHEDLDLAIHVSAAGQKVIYDSELLTGVSGRRIDTNIIDFCRYLRSMPRTYTAHGASEAKYVYPVAGFVLVNYLLLRVLFRGYDHETQGFKLRNLLAQQELQRVNPVTYVD